MQTDTFWEYYPIITTRGDTYQKRSDFCTGSPKTVYNFV